MTLFSVMRRPQWIGVLLLALAVAAIFAMLSQWQLSRAVTNTESERRPTETVVNLIDFVDPSSSVMESEAAQRVHVTGQFVPDGFGLIQGRLNDGKSGYWVTAQFSVAEPGTPALAVGMGWTADKKSALAVMDELASEKATERTLTGRYLNTEAPVASDDEDGLDYATTMSLARLVNEWPTLEAGTPVYGGFVIVDEAPAGLFAIDSPEPDQSIQLNWLNIFYAAEWVIFAGFAVYLWYRLAKDAWERETEERQDAMEAERAAESARTSGSEQATHAERVE